MNRDKSAMSWFLNKFKADLSGFNPSDNHYYEYLVYHFFKNHFTSAKLNNKRILDLGCGPGFYSFLSAKRGGIVTGVDTERLLIKIANRYLKKHKIQNTKIILGNFTRVLPRFKDNTFDLILAMDTIVTFNHGPIRPLFRNKLYIFQELYRVLASGGVFYIIEAHPWFRGTRLFYPDFRLKLLENTISFEGTPCVISNSHYKYQHKRPDELFHWSTIEEMTTLLQKSGFVVRRILEPGPDPKLKRRDKASFEYLQRYPKCIVYEIIKLKR